MHKLPDLEPLRSKWLDAVPTLRDSNVKAPSVCVIHFKPSDYGGKNKKYLKPDAIPSQYLDLKTTRFDVKEEEAQNSHAKITELPHQSICPRNECTDVYLKAKLLQNENKNLRNQIRMLEKKLKSQNSEDDFQSPAKRAACLKRILSESAMLGPTQIKCLVNNTTKGRGWTESEKEKAMSVKKMCNHKCYNYIRKNLVPLPCIWELTNDRNLKGTSDHDEHGQDELRANDQTKTEHVVECVSHNASEAELIPDNVMATAPISEDGSGQTVQTVHVVGPEIYQFQFINPTDGQQQKIEYYITEAV